MIPSLEKSVNRASDRGHLSSPAYFPASPKSLKHRLKRNPDIRQYTARRALGMVQPAQNRRIPHEQPAHVAIHRDMIKMTMPDYANGKKARPGADRGVIRGFSRASRKRMIEFMASIRGATGDMYFVTMTYDDWSWLRKPTDHHDDFEAFRKRFERAFPNWRAIWRVEVKTRQSGILTGSKVPHFHLLIFTGRNDDDATKEANSEGFRAWGVRVWGEILQTQNPSFEKYGYHVTPVRSRKHAASYVSKYIGKVDDDDISCGRRWGRIGQFDTRSSERVLLAYDEAIELKRLIRRWLRNKGAATPPPTNPKEYKKWLQRLKASRKLAANFARYQAASGFTVFGLGDGALESADALLWHGAAQLIEAAKEAARSKRLMEIG